MSSVRPCHDRHFVAVASIHWLLALSTRIQLACASGLAGLAGSLAGLISSLAGLVGGLARLTGGLARLIGRRFAGLIGWSQFGWSN